MHIFLTTFLEIAVWQYVLIRQAVLSFCENLENLRPGLNFVTSSVTA